jgi:hypothetical protein
VGVNWLAGPELAAELGRLTESCGGLMPRRFVLGLGSSAASATSSRNEEDKDGLEQANSNTLPISLNHISRSTYVDSPSITTRIICA